MHFLHEVYSSSESKSGMTRGCISSKRFWDLGGACLCLYKMTACLTCIITDNVDTTIEAKGL